MTCPIQFNDQPFRCAIKVSDIILDTMLPAKFSTIQLCCFQPAPQNRFSRCEIIPESYPVVL